MILELENIYKNFGEKKVLKGISFSAESGRAYGILGRNGAGKTTTIRIITGVFNSTSGTVLLDGKPIDRKSIRLGYLPEERGMYPKEKVMEQLLYYCELKDMSKKEATESILYWLDKMSMTEYKDKKLQTLSKGNQQKIQLICSICSNPDILILDEPFSGLDPVNAEILKNAIREVISKGKIVLFSSHQMNYIEEFCDDICILNNGKISISGNIKEIKHHYDRSKILIRSYDLNKTYNAISSIKTDYIKEISLNRDNISVQLSNADYKTNLMNDISKAKIDIDNFSVWEPTLNDIFVEYTEDKKYETISNDI